MKGKDYKKKKNNNNSSTSKRFPPTNTKHQSIWLEEQKEKENNAKYIKRHRWVALEQKKREKIKYIYTHTHADGQMKNYFLVISTNSTMETRAYRTSINTCYEMKRKNVIGACVSYLKFLIQCWLGKTTTRARERDTVRLITEFVYNGRT